MGSPQSATINTLFFKDMSFFGNQQGFVPKIPFFSLPSQKLWGPHLAWLNSIFVTPGCQILPDLEGHQNRRAFASLAAVKISRARQVSVFINTNTNKDALGHGCAPTCLKLEKEVQYH